MEEHIRKLFSLFDINKNGCLGFKEITGKIDWIYFLFQENWCLELLELLQVENTNELAWNLTNENEILNANGESW